MVKYGIYFAEPLWLFACLVLIPVVWLGLRNLSALSKTRKYLAITFRCLTILILIAMLAKMMFTRRNEHLTVLTVFDRSQSVPVHLQEYAFDYIKEAIASKKTADRFGVIDIAEVASISTLPSSTVNIRKRNTTLDGRQSRLSDGIQMALALAPPDTATRILLVSDGNETAGDLNQAARVAAANRIPIDVLPIRYDNKNEVVFKRLAAPATARSGQTISLRFILTSTLHTTGKLVLNLNDKAVDLSPGDDQIAVPIRLKPGTNVKTVSIPVGTRGMHDFKAFFIPDDPETDRIKKNNQASAITSIAGPGYIMVCDAPTENNAGSSAGSTLTAALKRSGIDARYSPVSEFPSDLTQLMDTDGILLLNTGCYHFTFQQQELISRFVTDMGGGLIMVGGDQAFGAGGWIGSPVAKILPVELDPPQKKQLPKCSLVLVIDHSGSMTGQKLEMAKAAAAAAVRLLNRRDQVGVVIFDTIANWLVPMTDAHDKDAIYDKIDKLGGGGGTIMYPAMEYASKALRDADTGIRHVILLTDGQTGGPDCRPIAAAMDDQGITISTIAVGTQPDFDLLHTISKIAGGRFYPVSDPQRLPQIFVKEAQIVRRSLINEETFTPILTYSLSEITKGISTGFPPLDGYVLTGPREGLSQKILSNQKGDPILASCQSGLGRAVAFTSSVDSRWAANWIGWSGFENFWEQVVRWAAKSTQNYDCDVFVDVQGKDVAVNVEAVDAKGQYMQFASIGAQVIAPDISSEILKLSQVGPGQYQGNYQAAKSGSYILNLRYRKIGEEDKICTRQIPVTIPFAPEFRDLSDNAKLLEDISEITGGRDLSKKPDVDLFDATGLKFPGAQMPLTKPLMLVWLAVFLTDIAVRRISIDFKTIYKKAKAFVFRPKTPAKAAENLQRLQRARQSAAEKLAQRSQKRNTAKRYDGSQKETPDMPLSQNYEEPEPETGKDDKKQNKTKQKKSAPQSHIDQLLKAKRKASEDEEKT